MLKWIFSTLIALFFISLFCFLVVHLVPGDPARLLLGERATPEAIEKVRQELKLDRPMHVQVLQYYQNLIQGDLGTSLRTQQPVAQEIFERLPATIELALAALLIALVVGVILGLLAAAYRGSAIDSLTTGFSIFGVSMPIFFLGLLLILLFSKSLGWLPTSGRYAYEFSYQPITGFVLIDSLRMGDFGLFRSALEHLVLPAATLATVPMGFFARLTRSSQIEAMQGDYIRTARAKGVSEPKIFLQHAFRNSLLPVITMAGLQLGSLLGGAILTETVFSWPGIGRWMVASIESRDYAAIQGGVFIFASFIILSTRLAEWLIAHLDPRQKNQHA